MTHESCPGGIRQFQAQHLKLERLCGFFLGPDFPVLDPFLPSLSLTVLLPPPACGPAQHWATLLPASPPGITRDLQEWLLGRRGSLAVQSVESSLVPPWPSFPGWAHKSPGISHPEAGPLNLVSDWLLPVLVGWMPPLTLWGSDCGQL